jgi:hypothetical protein
VNYGDVTVNYGNNNYLQMYTDHESFETLIINIGIQFSMNQEMLGHNQSPPALLGKAANLSGYDP